MFNKRSHDSFTFSLGGMTTVTSFVIAPAVADDRINRIRDVRMARDDLTPKTKSWWRLRRQLA